MDFMLPSFPNVNSKCKGPRQEWAWGVPGTERRLHRREAVGRKGGQGSCCVCTAAITATPRPLTHLLPPQIQKRLLGSELIWLALSHTSDPFWLGSYFWAHPTLRAPRGHNKHHIFISLSRGPGTAWHRIVFRTDWAIEPAVTAGQRVLITQEPVSGSTNVSSSHVNLVPLEQSEDQAMCGQWETS